MGESSFEEHNPHLDNNYADLCLACLSFSVRRKRFSCSWQKDLSCWARKGGAVLPELSLRRALQRENLPTQLPLTPEKPKAKCSSFCAALTTLFRY